ncbi:YceD family protein [Pseudobacteroides cellulosolvens]|uniref:DUF177 domain-containing protein n=1 Tax=Pseudobacteroides cellulosolvens ATCC 35603 = DSM 2933 TaxID=398512 RepID=A0A0L6JJX9_9FIRM|nr:DUF177 domain-containing protein [Pseudobacteroides cellulosolvens]KNY26055.1 protein of unknown function DUF177 [Pseudobacteroides cellulosolvens ATCC 35603 = DSM 2933]
MKIDVSSIVKINGASLDVKFDEAIAELNDLESGFVFTDVVKFEGVLTNASGVLKLNGSLKASYSVKCSRCVKDIEDNLELKVREDIIEGSETADVDAYTYNDNYILLDSILKDNIILNLPVKKVCDDNCKGLCPRCGTNLNEKTCDCKDDYINPQMEALKKFFDN